MPRMTKHTKPKSIRGMHCRASMHSSTQIIKKTFYISDLTKLFYLMIVFVFCVAIGFGELYFMRLFRYYICIKSFYFSLENI